VGTIGLDNEVDRQAVRRPRLGRANDGHQRSSGPDQASGPLLDVAANHIENQIDSAGVFQGVVVEIDELLRAEVERLLAVGRATGADDVGAELTCEFASPSSRLRRPRRARARSAPLEGGRVRTTLAMPSVPRLAGSRPR